VDECLNFDILWKMSFEDVIWHWAVKKEIQIAPGNKVKPKAQRVTCREQVNETGAITIGAGELGRTGNTRF
jgi:hypothetical protein